MEGLMNMRVGILWILFFAACLSNAQEVGTEEAVAEPNGTESTDAQKPDIKELRSWTLADGQTFEARYKVLMGGNVVMESSAGTQKKIALDRFAEEDIEWIELENPPKFDINFLNKSEQLFYSTRFILTDMPVVLLYTFGVQIKQTSAGAYTHEVNVEFFAIAAQRGHSNKFILVDRQTTSFMPSKKNNYFHEFRSPRIAEMDEYGIHDFARRGKKYDTYVVLVTDKRGEVIASKTPNKWLLENVDNLRKRSIGNYIDKTCSRVYPGRPKAELY